MLKTKLNATARQVPTTEDKLRPLAPISSLPRHYQSQLFKSAEVFECTNGHLLFQQGDMDERDLFIVEGEVDLYDGNRRVKQLRCDGNSLCFIDPRLPRPYTAMVSMQAQILSLPRSLLENLTNLVGSATPTADVEVDDIDSAETNNWMIRMLRSKAFANVPTANLHKLFLKMDSIPMREGELVVRQGDVGDYFYVIQAGAAAIKRRPRENAPEIKLAEIGPGDSFGEEALIGGKVRNASVQMISDGRVMRLEKQDFLELVKESLVREVDSRQATTMAEHGAKWIDIRPRNNEHQTRIEGSLNIELAFLREKSHDLDRQETYIICSDSAILNAQGAFILAAQGFDVCALATGLAEHLLEQGIEVPEAAAAPVRDAPQAARSAGAEPKHAPKSGTKAATAPKSAAGDVDAELVESITRKVEKQLRTEMEQAMEAERRRMEVELQARMQDYKTGLKTKMEKQQQDFKSAYKKKVMDRLRNAEKRGAAKTPSGD